jgi:predicted nucleic acid-binding protein
LFFVDTNIVIYAMTRSRYRDPCARVLEAVSRSQADGQTSAAVLEEIWHLELRGSLGDVTGLTTDVRALFAPVLPVTDDIFGKALALEVPPQLGAIDRVHAATCLVAGISAIVSADAGFDAVEGLRRVDPLDERHLRPLLGTRADAL